MVVASCRVCFIGIGLRVVLWGIVIEHDLSPLYHNFGKLDRCLCRLFLVAGQET